MATITLRYWAAARTAAGVAEQCVAAENCAAALDAALSQRDSEAATALERVLQVSSFLVDGIRRDRAQLGGIGGPAVVEVLPPFAGG